MLNNDVNPQTLSRLELLKLAHTLNVSDADVMTRAELRAAIERARKPDPRPSPQPVTWLGVARRLLASIVEQGLHLPDAAAVIRGAAPRTFPSGPAPVATVTLARIYAAQGHLERGIGTLDEVLRSDPDHDLARELRTQLQASLEERRQREREQRAADAAPPKPSASAAPAEESDFAEPEEQTSPASDLLGAVPSAAAAQPADALSSDEITLSSGALAQEDSAAPSAGELPRGPALAESEARALEARPAGLVLIETNEPSRYLYWELARPAPAPNGHGAETHWVCVVTYTPRQAGSERRERRFPVQHASGAVRLEGLSRHAVVRAKLSRGEAPEAPPLVVAGSVWAAELSALERAEPRFVPHAASEPGALAARAGDHLVGAAPIYC